MFVVLVMEMCTRSGHKAGSKRPTLTQEAGKPRGDKVSLQSEALKAKLMNRHCRQ